MIDINHIIQLSRGIDTTAICDADKKTRVVSETIACRSKNSRMCGPALTVRCRDDFFGVICAIESASPGDVLVVDGGAREIAYAGELFARVAQQKGLAGIIVDGGYRDMGYISGCDLPVFSRYITPMAGSTDDIGELRVPVICGGVVIRTGDIIVADMEGIVVLDSAKAMAVLTAASDIKTLEAAVIDNIMAGYELHECLNVKEHHESLQRGIASRLQFTV